MREPAEKADRRRQWARAYWWKRQGIKEKDMEALALLYSSAERCAICGRKLTRLNMALDHDHKTGKVRGILCKTCNLALGYLRDNPKTAEQAARYLRNPPPMLVVRARSRA
jgi:hypothetical protein